MHFSDCRRVPEDEVAPRNMSEHSTPMRQLSVDLPDTCSTQVETLEHDLMKASGTKFK